MRFPAFACRILFLALRALTAMLLVGFGAASAANAQGAGYWHTSGAQIYDSNNQPVRIAGINWYGFETTDLVAHGLSVQDYKTILQTIKNEGYNTVRIPFSNQMVETPGTNLNITYWANFGPANTDLQGLNSLQVLDKIVTYAGTVGLKIILDNHRSEAGNSAESNGLWYTSAYPESNWIADWQALATRYLGNPTVIGMDLRNEPHNAYSGGSCWDCGGANDWHLAAERGGNAVQAINPNLLLFVEGTDAYNNDYYWWGGNLEGVANSPVTLSVPHQLVYSAHDYGPNEYGQTWFNGSTTPASLDSVWTTHWAYISQQGIAPVWLGEFGTENSDSDVLGTASGSQGQWFQSLTTFLQTNPALNWTYWALNGEDTYGLLDSNYDATPVDALKQSTLASIQFPLSLSSASESAPSAPSALSATGISASQINLTWTASPTSGVTYTVFFGTSAGSIGTVLASGVSSTNYPATNLNSNATYYFTVEAVSANGNSPLSNTASAATLAIAPPAAPSALSATAISSSQINLSWAASSTSGVTYTVYSSANAIVTGVTGTSYSVTGLNASTTYSYTVVAISSAGSSTASNPASATTQTATPPTAPSSLSASATSSSQINLSWVASSTSGVTYTVYSSANAIATGLTATSYSVTGLNASTTYSYTVVAVSSAGASTASNLASATTLAATVVTPAAPFGLSASPASASQINLNWQPSTTSGVTYAVYMGTASGATTTLVASGLTGQNTAVSGLLDNSTYYFTVKAVTSGGVSSAASNQATATTQALPATAPTGLSASTISATQINLSWTAVTNTGATYAVYYGTSSGAENTLLATAISGTTYSATGLSASTTYYFIVRSNSAGGTSSPSSQASATTQSVAVPVVPVTPTTPTTPTVPTAPSGLVATAVSSTQINMSWSPSSTASVTYTVYSGSTAIASGLGATSYSVTGLTASTAYSFSVIAVSSAGSSAASNSAGATTQAAPAPSAPSGLSATATSSSQINLGWTASSTAGVTYSLYSGLASGAESNLVASGITSTSYSATGLNASTAYYFIVKAVASGTAGASSTASNQATATTQAAAAGGCHVSYLDQNDWGAGFTGALSITNNGSTAWTSWTVTWSYSGSQQIYQSWDGNYTQSGQQVAIANAAWNGSVAAGGTVSGIGWNANYSGTNNNPTTFYVNGVLCH